MSSEPAALPVPLQAHAARSCPTRLQWDVIRPVEPAPTTEFQRLLIARGLDHEDAVGERLLAAHPGAIDAGAVGDRIDRELATVAAMEAGAPLILRTRIPLDGEGRRTGEADLLVRVGDVPVDGRWRYAPVEVKLRRILDVDDLGDADEVDPDVLPTDAAVGDGWPVLPAGTQRLADLHVPAPEACVPVGAGTGRGGIADDLVQLAHYHRMLEALGRDATRAGDGAALAGVIGGEGVIAWFRLDAARLSVDAEVDPDGRESALDRYDREFAHRIAVMDAAQLHRRDPSVPLLELPVRHAECDTCPWRDHCAELRAASGDVSVLPRATRTGAWPALRAAGLATLPELAAHDPTVPVAGLRDAAVAALVAEARARVAPGFAFRRRPDGAIAVPRADVEVDVDMENPGGTDGCDAYLWGALVTDRTGTGVVPTGYHPSVVWDDDSVRAGAAAFDAFWPWLTDLRRACTDAGASVRFYCWHQQAEVGCLRDGAAALVAAGGPDHRDAVERLVMSDAWVDLKVVWQRQVVTGHGSGLKVVAPGLGFAWRDDDPGGAQSVVWWSHAVDPARSEAERQEWRGRILTYNHDDVRATLHVRDWLEREGPGLQPPPVPAA